MGMVWANQHTVFFTFQDQKPMSNGYDHGYAEEETNFDMQQQQPYQQQQQQQQQQQSTNPFKNQQNANPFRN